jgi:outer membrane translocation and assembly module TamA
MKSLRGEYAYTVPELFGESIDGTAKLFGLRREEIAFLRQEYGANFTLKRPVDWLRAEGTWGLTVQSLRNADNNLSTSAVDNKQTTVVSMEGSLSKERRDNPLRPRRGYRWFTQGEGASRQLAGQVDYQRLEVGGSYHTSFGSGRWVHLGLTHGVITNYGAKEDASVPVNKRFYPGGDRSIRGYQDGEAAPRGPDGRFVGAKSYTLFDTELEQALTKSWSVVLFGDALGTAATLSEYPFGEKLYSVGLGVRFHTLIGPLRLEYGRNVNPRPQDPHGTLHFSIGFPF